MAFLNPLFLFGILAAGIPLLIHLWNRRQAVTIDFSSLMFLVTAHRQSVKRLYFKHLLILILRMLIIALIALALARPFLTLGLPLAAVRAKTDVVIVLDNSFSMAYQDIDGVRFDKAKRKANEILNSLRNGDSASVILMSDIPKPIFNELTPDISGVLKSVNDAKVSTRDTNVQPSIEMAHKILSMSNQTNRELYLISDFTKNGWENWDQIPNVSGSRIFLISLSSNNSHNTNIEEISPSQHLIGVDLPLYLNIRTNNHSDTRLTQTTLSMFIQNKKHIEQSYSLDPFELTTKSINHHFSTAGYHIGSFELTSDRLNLDNNRYFVFKVLGSLRVLCVSDSNEIITLSLNPLYNSPDSVGHGKASMIEPIACHLSDFDEFPLDDIDILLLTDVSSISEKSDDKIKEFIRKGKDLIVFVSDKNNFTWGPAEFKQVEKWERPKKILEYDKTHPIFEIFDEGVLTGQYAPQFYSGMTVELFDDSNIIASFNDNIPFIIEKQVKDSKILFFNVALDIETRNELLLNPYFLPLIQNTVLYANHDETQRNILVGESYTRKYNNLFGLPAWIKPLDSIDENEGTAVIIQEDGTLKYDSTELPGIYQVEISSQGKLYREFFAVNTHPSESNLEHISLKDASQKINAQTQQSEDDEFDSKSLDLQRHGREIWGELLVLAVCLLLFEGFLSNRMNIGT
ncbi:BatA and WFA domain-containing protein [Candidatus Poribacteria bacterium]|nr:BatA and WFA domain-containing protein [Candidatus Poribacteria bacterium]